MAIDDLLAFARNQTLAFAYDAIGNVSVDNRGTGQVFTLTNGADSRLASVLLPSTATVTYKYNGLGERVSHIDAVGTAHAHYRTDGTLIAETDGTGTNLREYVWLDGKPLAFIEAGTIYFIHADHLDAPQKITDASKALVWDGQFTPFGRTHAIAATLVNKLRFPGQQADAATGYSYNYFRDYEPALGRYIQPDPIGPLGGINQYLYVDANPQNLVDPSGLRGQWVGFTYLTGALNGANLRVAASLAATGAGSNFLVKWNQANWCLSFARSARGGLALAEGALLGATFALPFGSSTVAARPVTTTLSQAPSIFGGAFSRLQWHHPIPKFLGGTQTQALVALSPAIHTQFHQLLRANLRAAGFTLPVGGRLGSTYEWQNAIAMMPAGGRQALDAVLSASRAIDVRYGTRITQGVWNNVMRGNYMVFK